MSVELENIVNLIRAAYDGKPNLHCTFDEENPGNFDNTEITAAIEKAIATRKEAAEKYTIAPEKKAIAGELEQLYGYLCEINANSDKQQLLGKLLSGGNGEDNCKSLGECIQALKENIKNAEKASEYLNREQIKVPVVGNIHCGKSTFLKSALGLDAQNGKHLFPSASGKSCTGTRTVLIFDGSAEETVVTAYFYPKEIFRKNCLAMLDACLICVENDALSELRDAIKFGQSEPLEALGNFAITADYTNIANQPNANDSDIITSLSSYVELARDHRRFCNVATNGYLEERDAAFNLTMLRNAWENGQLSMVIPADNNWEDVEKYVCKYSPVFMNSHNQYLRYTSYCCIDHVEIRGNLCPEISGLELWDTVGNNDLAIDDEMQRKMLLESSDALIYIAKPEAQTQDQNIDIEKYSKAVAEQRNIDADSFLNIIINKSDTDNALAAANDASALRTFLAGFLNYGELPFAGVYVTDASKQQEVQEKVLVGVLAKIAGSVSIINEHTIKAAEEARNGIDAALTTAISIAKTVNEACGQKDINFAAQNAVVNAVLEHISLALTNLKINILSENDTALTEKTEEIAQALVGDAELVPSVDALSLEFGRPLLGNQNTAGGKRATNRYIVYLQAHYRLLQLAERKFDILLDDMSKYIVNKKVAILNILLGSGMGEIGKIVNCPEVTPNTYKYSSLEISERLSANYPKLSAVISGLLNEESNPRFIIATKITPIINSFDHNNLCGVFETDLPIGTDPIKKQTQEAEFIHNWLVEDAQHLAGALEETLCNRNNPAENIEFYVRNITVITTLIDGMINTLNTPEIRDELVNLYLNNFNILWPRNQKLYDECNELKDKITDLTNSVLPTE